MMKKCICKFFLKVMGWKAIEPPVPEPKCIILGVPHTSTWDFIISYLYYGAVGGKAYVIIKKEFFFWPLGPIIRSLGGIPIDRAHSVSVVKQVIDAFKKRDTLHLAIAPEGTRKAIAKWKTGFHTMAKAAGVPVYLGYFDWGKKIVGRGEKFELTDDAQSDLIRIQQHYKKMGVVGKHPERLAYMA